MTPALVWRQLWGCFLTGVLLGPAVDLFRPAHRRFPVMAQLLIALEVSAAWVFVSFGLCRGDLRLGWDLALAAGFGGTTNPVLFSY